MSTEYDKQFNQLFEKDKSISISKYFKIDNCSKGSNTVYNKWKGIEIKEKGRSPRQNDLNGSPNNFLKSIYNKSDWSVLKNMQLKMPNIL